MRERFLDALHSGRVLLMDGAMGTEIQRAGARPGECLELWNLTHPDRIRAIHQSYVDAGATCLVTNTFQAARQVLLSKGVRGADCQRINERGVELARSVGDGQQFVLASVGPPSDLWGEQPPNQERLDRAADDCLAQIALLKSADAILLETQCSVDLIAAVLRRNPSVTAAIPFLVSFTYCKEGAALVCTTNQALPDAVGSFVHREQQHIAALGVNCGRGIGMDDIIGIVREYRQHTSLPLFARPNAGTPTREQSGWKYPLSPTAMAERLSEHFAAGAIMVGGCCGTTPEHIAAMAAKLR